MRRQAGAFLGLLVFVCSVAFGGAAPERPSSPTRATAAAATKSKSSEAEAIRLLNLLEKRHADHRRVEGEFTQIRRDPVFLEDISSTGTFYFERPDRFRCDYTEPTQNASSHLVIGDFVESYYPSIKQVERYRMQREGLEIGDTNYMLLAFGINTDKIRKYFTIRDIPTTAVDRVRLAFVPKAPPEKRPFKRFVLELSERAMQPVRFEIWGDDGDYTLVKINRISWNPNWEDDAEPEKFQLKYPPDVEIITQP